MAPSIDFDHVALASEHAHDNFDRYHGDLGGQWLSGGLDPGFYWGQVRFANGVALEMLEPANLEQDDFLRRFLDRSGPGPHHFTFKVPDIYAAIDAATAGGYAPVRANTTNEHWQEAFLHPKQSHGIVVQLAQYDLHDHPQPGLPPARVAEPAALELIVHAVADLDPALGLFCGVLTGEPVDDGADGPDRWVELAWPGRGRVRLVEARSSRLLAWVGARPGRLDHLAFTLAEPAAVPGATPRDDGAFEIGPEDNLGVRLRLRPTA